MLDIGWTELLVIGVVALIVVGPKDLPVMFHNIGKFTGRMRTMAREFTRAMDDAAQSSGARDLARDLRTMSNPTSAGKQAFKKATGLDDLDDPFGEGAGERATTAPASPAGAHTAKLAEERSAAARARREEAVARANARAAAYVAPEGAARGGDAGVTAAPDAGPDAASDAGPDAGPDAGARAGVTAAPVPGAGAAADAQGAPARDRARDGA